MLTQFFSSDKLVKVENQSYFNISSKEKLIFELKKNESNVVKYATENIVKNLNELNR
ncbi:MULTISPECIES: hypothetical protein [unclassified Sutcliffiella]|uniref:hypothetical protein n=1 Tax=unclassified Sutcliffiella TaxID=2837532 RepID=UPI0030D243DB